ncbi:unnamed protein product [Clonostachys rosea f. rosea IK726]|uniref:Uncharacterized protein n=2 Tax=Bionectria ochroleuca TaxID=29856 RepID=A0A0B7KA38_BIOOC|nr:unnamed protein product [Clonostachys rosea f. rosea IK726]
MSYNNYNNNNRLNYHNGSYHNPGQGSYTGTSNTNQGSMSLTGDQLSSSYHFASAPPLSLTGDAFHFGDNLTNSNPTKVLLDLNVASQINAAPTQQNRPPRNNYPHQFHNRDRPAMDLAATGTVVGYPLLPGSTPYNGGDPGTTRGFYNENQRDVYNVGYHDTTRPPVGRGRGRGGGRGRGARPSNPFTNATFIPADHELPDDKTMPALTEQMFQFDQARNVDWGDYSNENQC